MSADSLHCDLGGTSLQVNGCLFCFSLLPEYVMHATPNVIMYKYTNTTAAPVYAQKMVTDRKGVVQPATTDTNLLTHCSSLSIE